MKQIIQDLKNGQTLLEEVPAPLVKPGSVQKQKHFDFEPHFGWRNHIELPNYEY